MRTLILDPPSAGLDEVLARRRRSGLDRLDEVWEGVLHMVPAPGVAHARIAQQLAILLDAPARAAGLMAVMHEFNVGEAEHDYRIPDGGLLHPEATGVWLATAALVVEIVSPGDESWEKLPFYAARNVDEVLILDPATRTVHWLALDREQSAYRVVERSGLIDLTSAALSERIDWP
ncbi:MAG: Uma2 family endonuclease [Solirubrobacteraceae bacterium]